MAIIKNKSIRMGIELPEFLLQLIAENITANVRQIEGTVNKIMAYQDLMGDTVDKDTVVRAVKDMFKDKSDIVPTADVIIDEVCKFYNIEPDSLRGQGPHQGHLPGPADRHVSDPPHDQPLPEGDRPGV